MKSYSQYTKEQNKIKQDKIDLMKPIDRIDYLNRYDRTIDRYRGCWSLTIANCLMCFSGIFLLFSALLFSLETDNSIIMYFAMSNLSLRIFLLGIGFIYLAIFEYIIRKRMIRKQINELDGKYNI